MYILGLGMLIAKLFRNIFFLIDSVIFNQIPKIYNLLLAIARTSPLSQADIADMASRIYKLLAVFMIFKVTFSLIMYVVNPDDFSDKSKGVSKLITNIVISLALLVLTPYIFSYAYQLQTIVLENNTLAAVIFGEKEGTKATLNNAGDNISFLAISPFIIPNLDHFDCATLYKYDRAENKNVLEETCFGFADVDHYSCDGNGDSRTLCKNTKSSSSNYLQEDDIKNYAAGIQFSNYNLLLRSDLITKYYDNGKDNEFAFDYSYIMSTVVGVLIVLFLITTCMDIGLRSIKLAFLQLIAPIPILSYIDPKGGKDGMFKKWYDMAFKTYLSIFVRLLALYFAIYIIGRVNKLVDIIDGSYVTNGYIKIFIIIGALMFAKNFIKILESLGIKFDGGFELNPIKKFNEQALGGKRITGAAGALAAGTADRFSRLATSPWPQKLAALNPFTAIGQTVRGAASNGGFSGGMKSQANLNRRLRESRIKGLSPTAAYMDYFGSKFGLDNATLEKEGTYIQRSKDNAFKARKEYEHATVQKEIEKDQINKHGAVRKNTQASFNEVSKQLDNVLKNSEDFLGKKGDFDTSSDRTKKLAALEERYNRMKSNNVQSVLVGQNADGSARYQNLDEYYLKEKRKINEKNYKSNRKDDAANVQHLRENQGKSLEHDLLVGDKFFAAGTYIDGNIVTEASNAQDAYMKTSHKGATNDMNTLIKMQNIEAKDVADRTDEEIAFFAENEEFYNYAKAEDGILGKNQDDFRNFENIMEQAEVSINNANENVSRYNSEYAKDDNFNKLESIDYNTGASDIYSVMKSTKGNVEQGNGAKQLYNEISNMEEAIRAKEKEIQDIRNAIKTDYIDESGKHSQISLDEYDKLIKIREEELNELKNRHRELINIHEAGGK